MPLKLLGDAHDGAKAQFTKLVEMQKKLGLAQDSLGSLTKLGEMLDPNDVIKAAGKMIAGGIEPKLIAGWLAEMPQAPGQPLQVWVGQHMQQLGQAQQQLAPMLNAARHQLGISALGVLTGHHMIGPDSGQASQGVNEANPASLPVSPNALTAQTPTSGSA